jgi:hypothetical protein
LTPDVSHHAFDQETLTIYFSLLTIQDELHRLIRLCGGSGKINPSLANIKLDDLISEVEQNIEMVSGHVFSLAKEKEKPMSSR